MDYNLVTSILDISEFKKKIKKSLQDSATDVVEKEYKRTKRVQITAILYNNKRKKGVLVQPTLISMNILGKIYGNDQVTKDIVYKKLLIDFIRFLSSKQEFDEYVFYSEMWYKSMPVEKKEELKNIKQGDIAKDIESREGVLIHYETKSSYVISSYAVKRKYEKGKILEKLSNTTSEESEELHGNLCNVIYQGST